MWNVEITVTKQKQLDKSKVPSIRYPYFTKLFNFLLLGDSQKYVPPILVPSSVKRITTQILVIAKLNGRKDFILRVFVCDIIHPSKELPVQS